MTRNVFYILTTEKRNCSFLIALEKLILHYISRDDTNVKGSDSLLFVGLTFSADMKLNDYIELIAKTAAREAGWLCRA